MTQNSSKIAYGDFQTPLNLACEVCKLIGKGGVNPQTVIEPTCGIGNFLNVARDVFCCAKNIYGYEINEKYVVEALSQSRYSATIRILCHDFFSLDWKSELSQYDEPLLILGNLPWVTSSGQGLIYTANLPKKNNFLKLKGLDAITGKANFDISEWMLIALIEATRGIKTDIAVLVKTIVARKILHYIHKNDILLSHASMYNIDAKKYFNTSVASCLFHIKLNYSNFVSNTCSIFASLEAENVKKIYFEKGEIINKKQNTSTQQSSSPQKWRSGIKHDAAKVMELIKCKNEFINGFGSIIDIEDKYLYPLFKGSDVANNRYSNKWVIVPQSFVGEDTKIIQESAPKTWEYLNTHSKIFDSRRSVIYNNRSRFSVFGIGEYAFKCWKISICGLYKKLSFSMLGPMNEKPCMFDDTVYFVSFDSKAEALHVYNILTSQKAVDFFNSFIFWDDKRPIKTSILNKFDWNLF